jgi:thiol-disulfide isomerase/thioredoxin
MRGHSLIALLVVCGFVALNLGSAHNAQAVGNRQDEPTTKSSLPKIGTERPELSLHLLSGGPDPRWQTLEGQVVVMDFWATWCPPCIDSIPHLNELRTKFEKEKVKFFSVTYEPAQYVREFLKEHPMATEVAIDDSLNTFKTFRAWAFLSSLYSIPKESSSRRSIPITSPRKCSTRLFGVRYRK